MLHSSATTHHQFNKHHHHQQHYYCSCHHHNMPVVPLIAPTKLVTNQQHTENEVAEKLRKRDIKIAIIFVE